MEFISLHNDGEVPNLNLLNEDFNYNLNQYLRYVDAKVFQVKTMSENTFLSNIFVNNDLNANSETGKDAKTVGVSLPLKDSLGNYFCVSVLELDVDVPYVEEESDMLSSIDILNPIISCGKMPSKNESNPEDINMNFMDYNNNVSVVNRSSNNKNELICQKHVKKENETDNEDEIDCLNNLLNVNFEEDYFYENKFYLEMPSLELSIKEESEMDTSLDLTVNGFYDLNELQLEENVCIPLKCIFQSSPGKKNDINNSNDSSFDENSKAVEYHDDIIKKLTFENGFDDIIRKCNLDENGMAEECHESAIEKQDKHFNGKENKKKSVKSSSKKRSFTCNVCDKVFKSSSNFKSHFRIHTGTKPYQCSFCDKKFTQSGHLQSHFRRHTGEKPYTCSLCKAAFAQRTSLKVHLENVHKNIKPPKKAEIEYKFVTNFYCKFCNRTYIGETFKKDHMKTHKDETKVYSCAVCCKQYKGRKFYDNHVKSHSDSVVSNDCFTQRLPVSPREKINLKIKLKNNKNFNKFVRVETDKNNSKLFHCKVCCKVFKHPTNVSIHLRTHTGERPYKCEVCDSYFRQLSHLKDHYSRHTGERPYSCTLCGRKFARHSAVSNHLKVKHPNLKGGIARKVVGGDSNGEITILTEIVKPKTVEIQITDP